MAKIVRKTPKQRKAEELANLYQDDTDELNEYEKQVEAYRFLIAEEDDE